MRPFAPAVVPGLAWVWSLAGCAGAPPAPQAPIGVTVPAEAPPAPPAAQAAAPEPAPAPEAARASDVAARTLSALTDGFNAHDPDRVASAYTEDCEVEAPPAPALRGRDALLGDLRRTFAAFGDARSALLRGWVKGNLVVSEVAWSGTMSGEFLGLKATGKPVGLIALRVLHLADDGRVKVAREYSDVAGLLAQMRGKKGAPPVPVLPTNALALHDARGTPDEDRLAAWARDLDATFDRDDPRAAGAVISEDADLWTNYGGAPWMGKREIARGLAAWYRAFPDQRWTVTDAWGIDGFAIVEHTMTATQKGTFLGRPGSRKPVAGWHRLDVLQPAADGTVLHDWGFANLMEMWQQTGAMKLPAETTTTNVAPRADAAPAPEKQ